MLDIKVIGPGCANCTKLADLCREVVEENNFESEIQKVTDTNEFWKYGIVLTPGLVVNGKILVQGKLPTKKTLENWLQREANQ